MKTHKLLAISPADQVALMPVAPSQAMIPRLSSDPAIVSIHERLAYVHYLAFVAIHGTPPADVAIRCTHVTQPGDPAGQPAYMAVLQGYPTPRALAWIEAFKVGLDRWSDAEFQSPIDFEPVDASDPDSPINIIVTDTDAVLQSACLRLLRTGQNEQLRNLAAVAPDDIAARFNPDHPSFAGARR